MTKRENVLEKSGLVDKPLSFLETTSIIIGTNIGAGILGLAFASRKSGYLPLLFWLLTAGAITCISMLYVAEVCLRTKGNHQLSGLMRRYFGQAGAGIIFFGVASNTYGALIAYMTGSGQILASFFSSYGLTPLMGSCLFLLPVALVLFLGLKALGVGEKYLSVGLVVLIFTLIGATTVHENLRPERLLETHWLYMVPVFNVAVFCFSAQYMVPEMVRGNKSTPRKIPAAIILGTFCTFVFLAAMPAAIISLCGLNELSEVATINWGMKLGPWAYFIANIFALIAMLTSYWGLGGSLFTNIFDLFKLGDERNKLKRMGVLTLVCLPPLIIVYSDLASFVDALYFAGSFGGIIMTIAPVFMLRKARMLGELQPAWGCGWYAVFWLQGTIILLYAASAIYAILAAFGRLPTGW